MYSILDYGDMILDRGRIEAYANAIRARVTPDSVVLDIGAGPGILTLIACQAGARKVYAVENDGVIEVARETVAASGFADRVEFIQSLSTEVSLPEKVDVVVSDLRGALPFHLANIASILDARDRFLKPGGYIIAEKDTLFAAVASAPKSHKRIVAPWSIPGIDYRAAQRRAVNFAEAGRFGAGALLVAPAAWAVLDYHQLQSCNAKGTLAWTITRTCEGHGLCLWFDCVTAPGYGFSNSPSSGEEHVYRQVFFSWPEACQLEPGDEVSAEIRVDWAGQDYIYCWNTEIREPERQQPIKKMFRQSTFLSRHLSRDWFRKSAAAFVPSPNKEAAIDRMILELFHSGISLEEISRCVADRFPERFPGWRKALNRVGEMSLRYSQ